MVKPWNFFITIDGKGSSGSGSGLGLGLGLGLWLGFDLDFFTENFQRKKKKFIVGIRTHAHSLHGLLQLPLGYQVTLVELRLNHTFNIQLILVFTVS